MHRLALALGRTVAELKDTLSSSEMSNWIEYYKLEPWGAWRDNWHASILASIMSGSDDAKMEDYMYRYVEPIIDENGRASESGIDGIFGL